MRLSSDRIPVPPSFPVTWDDPAQAGLLWTFDPMHAPNPMPVLACHVWDEFHHGFTHAYDRFQLPLAAWLGRRINTYHYHATVPLALSPAEMAARAARSEELLDDTISRLMEVWNTEWLPDVQAHLAFWEQFDLDGASLEALVAHFDETLRRTKELGHIHFEIAIPHVLAQSQFDETYRELFPGSSQLSSQELVQGFDNLSLAMGRELWALRNRAKAEPAVRMVLEQQNPDRVMEALYGSAEGRAFLQQLQGFLAEYGHRANRWEITDPTWLEDPTPVIFTLKEHLGRPDADPLAELKMRAEEREQLIAKARERLTGHPASVVNRFETQLRGAQEATVLVEDHNHWIDGRGHWAIRRVIITLGARLAALGLLEQADDIMHLWPDEVRACALAGVSQKQLVAERKAEIEQWRGVTPPPVLGTMPPPAPTDTPMAKAIFKFLGGPVPQSEDPKELKGQAGSAGKVVGRARVLRSLAEAGSLQRGEILVTETTAPPWTPLFAVAGAVVTDAGGVLSHCAIVAREYRIPAVLATGRATAVIRTGQLLEVDGSNGVVKILS